MAFQTIAHHVDLCVVGGGMAGLCAAVAAARQGIKVALMHDRPMLGGNASSEIRMWVCGSEGENMRESGIIEEIELENQYRNPDKNYSIWDNILYELVREEENILLLLNCSCMDAEMEKKKIISITGWQSTTQQYNKVHAQYFADCSGDSILAPLSGAHFRVGREGKNEFNEPTAPETSDDKTMGLSCLMTAREESVPSSFIPPGRAYTFTKKDLPFRIPKPEKCSENFWYIELGGEGNSIAHTEDVRDELLRIAFGIWDYIKNGEDSIKYANWRLEWMGMLPGKRESRRYVGDYILTENDVRKNNMFPDVIGYGGWPLDDHDPAGFWSTGPPNVSIHISPPYEIPYRCLYSENIDNLFFAGRNISVTHAALSSTRVMGTCAVLGQAIGTAAAIAAKAGFSPREVGQKRIQLLQQALMEDDCYLPGRCRMVPKATRNAKLTCAAKNGDALRDGFDRPSQGEEHGVVVPLGTGIEYSFPQPIHATHVRMVFDSDLNRNTLPKAETMLKRNMIACRPLHWPLSYVPKTLVKGYTLMGLKPDGTHILLKEERQNRKRLVSIALDEMVIAVTLIPSSTWGADACRIFSFDVDGKPCETT